jgi:hypothetical protein
MFFKLQETKLEIIIVAGEEAEQFQGEKWKLSLAEMVSYLNLKHQSNSTSFQLNFTCLGYPRPYRKHSICPLRQHTVRHCQ